MTDMTDQLALWSGDFGRSYMERNPATPETLRALAAMWSRVLQPIALTPPRSILEVGANLGLNLRTLRALSAAELSAVEPNPAARQVLVDDGVIPAERVHAASAQALPFASGAFDLVFTSGVLIHIHPDDLGAACDQIHRCSRRYIACLEYFSDSPREIPYRGHSEALFTRDFGSFWMDRFPTLRCLDHGFFWKRVNGIDNLNWWLFEKAPQTDGQESDRV